MPEKSNDLINLLWPVVSVILGFQITAFIFRLQRETHFSWQKRHFPISEYLNLLSIALLVAGVFVMPLVCGVQPSTIKGMFTAAITLLVFYPPTVVAHYEILFRRKATKDSTSVCSLSEGILSVLGLLTAGTLGYLVWRS